MYAKLDAAFKKLEANRAEISYDINEIQTSEDVIDLKGILDKHGVVIFRNAVSKPSVANLHKNIAKCAKDMFDLDVKKDIFADLNPHRNSTNHFANASFSYFFLQPARLGDPCSVDDYDTESGTDERGLLANVYFTQNTGYQVNLALLEDNPHTAAILFGLTHPEGGMVSWDSFKLANNPRPRPKTMTKQTLTKCHFDAYGDNDKVVEAVQRIQAMISIEDRIKLGYVPDSTNPEIKQLLLEITQKPNLYKTAGFKTFADKQLIDVFNKYIVAPPSGSLVLWKSGIIHYEAEFTPRNDICRFKSLTDLPNQKRIRCPVGTHLVYKLPQSEVKELAVYAENGLLPDMYFGRNKDTKIGKNIMCSKNTQYRIYRKLEDPEELQDIIEEYDEEDKCDEVLDEMTNLKKYMYGINCDVSDLEISDEDKVMLREMIRAKV